MGVDCSYIIFTNMLLAPARIMLNSNASGRRRALFYPGL
jgi:hypothetical protein